MQSRRTTKDYALSQDDLIFRTIAHGGAELIGSLAERAKHGPFCSWRASPFPSLTVGAR